MGYINHLAKPSLSEYIAGGIYAVTIMDRSMIIFTSAAATDELDKWGAVYSDRPVLEIAMN
jgi:hypothetical protein